VRIDSDHRAASRTPTEIKLEADSLLGACRTHPPVERRVPVHDGEEQPSCPGAPDPRYKTYVVAYLGFMKVVVLVDSSIRVPS
jgi:hypothetical protein